MDVRPQTLVFGSGDCARELAELLDAQEIDVILAATPGSAAVKSLQRAGLKRIELIEGYRLTDCQGQGGSFQVRFEREGIRAARQVAAIVVAEDAWQRPNFGAYGVQPSRRVIALSEMEAHFAAAPLTALIEPGAQVAFLNGLHADSHPVTAARMLRLCLRVQKSSARRTAYLTGNLKVAFDGMEACCQEAKAAGTLFLKFSQRMPEITTMNDGRIRIDYWDEASRMDFGLTADYVIVDETIGPHPSLAHLAGLMRLERDAAGYLQSDNVHRLSNATNRSGIFVAGASRGNPAHDQQRTDAAQAALKVCEFLRGLDGEPRPGVAIDQGRCARCLTCYRLCPYAAIEMAPRMTIVAQACQSCGLCAAGCPNQAIGVDDADLTTALRKLSSQADDLTDPQAPRIAFFGCRRSAVQARELAIQMGRRMPRGMLFIEGLCSGTFSVNHLLGAFDSGADGVMILACHPGNCHSENGTTHARKRVAQAAKALGAAGIDPARIAYGTLSANMGTEFARLAEDFAGRIAALGPIWGSVPNGRTGVLK
ncbi:MAG: hydrogenase iron-sulfur subunit [Desulfobacteraceae bacterium]|nr:MAG: hydrogenase iron-sulfur subunit [Desulfobacteraceae bacterium]